MQLRALILAIQVLGLRKRPRLLITQHRFPHLRPLWAEGLRRKPSASIPEQQHTGHGWKPGGSKAVALGHAVHSRGPSPRHRPLQLHPNTNVPGGWTQVPLRDAAGSPEGPALRTPCWAPTGCVSWVWGAAREPRKPTGQRAPQFHSRVRRGDI